MKRSVIFDARFRDWFRDWKLAVVLVFCSNNMIVMFHCLAEFSVGCNNRIPLYANVLERKGLKRV